MYSSLIGKIEKAKRYSEEKERVKVSQFKAEFRGEHGSYEISYDGDKWSCTCQFFAGHGLCSHTMALQRILEGMLPEGQLAPSLSISL